jgi:uncharacterized membrane protein YozB (DUF420 family)
MTRALAYLALFLTCVVPVAAGIYRGTTLLLEWDWAPSLLPDRVDNLPLLLHVTGASVFYLLAALQILPTLRRRFPRWHRQAGRVAVIAGVISAISCTWLTVAHPDARGPILYFGRLIFGPLWTIFLLQGYLAARRKNFPSHRDWMIRAFAVAMPAGTLVFIIIPFTLVLGEISVTLDESIQSGAWVVHLTIAEYLIRRRRSHIHRPA